MTVPAPFVVRGDRIVPTFLGPQDLPWLGRLLEEAAGLAGDADAALGLCSAELLAAGPDIRWIQSYSAGVEPCVAVPALREGLWRSRPGRLGYSYLRHRIPG